MTDEFGVDELRNLDLNLCLVLSIMVREQSVRRTAETLRVGSPAVSMAINRLRELFSDPLFVRTGRGMSATPRAQQLATIVDPFLHNMRSALRDAEAFDPKTIDRNVRIAIADDLEVLLLPDLLALIREEAPRVKIQVRNANYLAIDEALQSGDADLSVVALLDPLPREPHRIAYTGEFLVLYDSHMIGKQGDLDMAAYLEIPQLLLSPRGESSGMVEAPLSRIGAERQIVATLARFSTLPFILKRTRSICNVPALAARKLAKQFDLEISQLPFKSPRFDVGVAWQRTLHRDPMTLWLVEKIVTLLQRYHREAAQNDL